MDPMYEAGTWSIHRGTQTRNPKDTHAPNLTDKQICTKDQHIVPNNYTPTTADKSSFFILHLSNFTSFRHTHTHKIPLNTRAKLQIMQCEDQVRIRVDDRLKNMQVFASLNPPISGGLRVLSGRETCISG